MDRKNSQTTPATTSTTPIRQLPGATDAQTAHHATSSTAPAHQPLGRAGGTDVPPVQGSFKGGSSPAPPLCDIPLSCCFFTGPWTVTRSSLRILRRVAAFCRPLRLVLLLVLFPCSRSPGAQANPSHLQGAPLHAVPTQCKAFVLPDEPGPCLKRLSVGHEHASWVTGT